VFRPNSVILGKVSIAGSYILPTDTANFSRRNYGCSDVQFCSPINIYLNGFLAPSFAFLDKHFSTRKFIDNFPTTQNSGEGVKNRLLPLARRHWGQRWPL